MASLLKPVVGSAQLSALGLVDRLVSFFVAREHTRDFDEEFRYYALHGDARPYKKARAYKDQWISPIYKRQRKFDLLKRLEHIEQDHVTNLHAITYNTNVQVMCDSGAFALWKRGTPVDIEEYIDFVIRHKDYIEVCVNMDVIPSKYGQKRTVEQVEQSARESYENLIYLKSRGLKPLPVFHRGENFSWIKRMLDDGEEYVGVSPRSSDAASLAWLDKVFTLLTNSNGRSVVNVHGFGITASPVLYRYPWFSCDSTTWSTASSMGCILFPKYIGGRERYDLAPTLVYFADSNPKKTLTAYASLPPLQQKAIMDYVEEAEVTPHQLKYDYLARAKCTGLFYKRILDQINKDPKPFTNKVRHLSWLGE